MKKIDILNFITNFRKSPNDVKSYEEIRGHLKAEDESKLIALLAELKQLRVIKEIEVDGKKSYQVTTK